MSNPYKSEEPTVISFSGGRTSAFMLWKVLDAYNGELPDNFKVCFANTGKEMPETLDFVRDCQEKWGVDITWLEFCPNEKFKVVSYEAAAKDGEPFAELIVKKKYVPNLFARFCTSDLKVIPINKYLESVGFQDFSTFVGIRADEPRRVAKQRGKEGYVLPLADENIGLKDIYDFWSTNDFDLNLPNINGYTHWGNCDLCYLKSYQKKLSIIRERPDLVGWWVDKEKVHRFRTDHLGYEEMQIIATSQNTFDFGDDETIPCFCGD